MPSSRVSIQRSHCWTYRQRDGAWTEAATFVVDEAFRATCRIDTLGLRRWSSLSAELTIRIQSDVWHLDPAPPYRSVLDAEPLGNDVYQFEWSVESLALEPGRYNAVFGVTNGAGMQVTNRGLIVVLEYQLPLQH
jgi:hypothetical protein